MINRVADNGGAEVSLVQSLAHLESLGLHNIVQPLYDTEDTRRRQALERLGVEVLPATGHGVARRVLALRRTIRRSSPHVVHSALWEADLAARLAAALTRVPSVVSFVNMQYSSEARKAARSRLRLGVYQVADGWLARHMTTGHHALTNAVADSMADALGIRREHFVVVPRGRELSELGDRSAERSRVVRERLGLQINSQILLIVGRQEPQKNQTDAVEAFAYIATNYPSAQLVLAGRPGSASEHLRASIESSLYRDRIHVLGNRADVADLIVAADVVAVPSLWEGFGGVVAEAMYLETPIVAYDTPAVSEVLGGTGVLVRVGDVRGLGEAIMNLLANPDTGRELGVRARERASALYDVRVVAARMADLYADIALAHPLPRSDGRLDRLAIALQRRRDRGGLASMAGYLLGRGVRPLAAIEHLQVLGVDAKAVESDRQHAEQFVRLPERDSTLRGGTLVEGEPPTQREGLPRGRAAWFGVRDDGGRLRGRVCLELETETGSHRGFSPRLAAGEAVVSALWLDKPLRGKGVASALVRQAIVSAREEEAVERVLALVNVHNDASRRLFLWMGFREERRAYVLRLPGPRRVALWPPTRHRAGSPRAT